MQRFDEIDKASLRDDIPAFRAGDTVKVHVKVVEGTRSRVQVFQGVVIRRHGGGIGETFTVRKVSFGVGVERTFPLHTPIIDKIEVVTRGDVRRAKLYYLRDLRGKAAKIKEKRDTIPAKLRAGPIAPPGCPGSGRPSLDGLGSGAMNPGTDRTRAGPGRRVSTADAAAAASDDPATARSAGSWLRCWPSWSSCVVLMLVVRAFVVQSLLCAVGLHGADHPARRPDPREQARLRRRPAARRRRRLRRHARPSPRRDRTPHQDAGGRSGAPSGARRPRWGSTSASRTSSSGSSVCRATTSSAATRQGRLTVNGTAGRRALPHARRQAQRPDLRRHGPAGSAVGHGRPPQRQRRLPGPPRRPGRGHRPRHRRGRSRGRDLLAARAHRRLRHPDPAGRPARGRRPHDQHRRRPHPCRVG